MQTVVITGANRGIGLALTKLYLTLGMKVVALCRTSSPELNATNAIIIDNVELTDISAITTIPARIESQLGNCGIDYLINNAGIFQNEALPSLDIKSIQEQFTVNALAPITLSTALLPLLSPNAKIAFITSRMGSISDNSSGAYYGYRMSKAALNAGAVSLARDLYRQGIAVAILHPGFVQTQMVNFTGDISADTAAERLARRIDELNLANSGSFWHSNGDVLPW